MNFSFVQGIIENIVNKFVQTYVLKFLKMHQNKSGSINTLSTFLLKKIFNCERNVDHFGFHANDVIGIGTRQCPNSLNRKKNQLYNICDKYFHEKYVPVPLHYCLHCCTESIMIFSIYLLYLNKRS